MGDVVVRVGAALQELEAEDAPELGVGPLQVGADALAVHVGEGAAGRRRDRHPLDAGQVARVLVEEAVARPAARGPVLAAQLEEEHQQRALLAHLGRVRREDVVEARPW